MKSAFYSQTPLTSLIWLILILLFLGVFALIARRMLDVYLPGGCITKVVLLNRKYSAMDFQATRLNKNGGYDGGISPSMWQKVKLEDGWVWCWN